MAFRCCRKVLSFPNFPFTRNLSYSSSSSSSFDPPIPITTRRVVVIGLGLVTPLGCGVEATWKRLIEGKCGIRAITSDDLKMDGFDEGAKVAAFEQLTSRVARIVSCGSNPAEFDEEIWLQNDYSVNGRNTYITLRLSISTKVKCSLYGGGRGD